MKTKQKVLLGIAGLTALAVAGGSVGTMAWFYSNTTVTASGLSMSVNAPSSLLKIASGVTTVADSAWSNSISIADSGLKLTPVRLMQHTATGNSLLGYYLYDGSRSDLYFAVPATINSDGSAGSGETNVNSATDATYFKRIDFQIKNLDQSLWNSTKMKEYSYRDSTITLKITLTGTYKPIHKALRFFIVGTDVGNEAYYCVQSDGYFGVLSTNKVGTQLCAHQKLAQSGLTTETFVLKGIFPGESNGSTTAATSKMFTPKAISLFLYLDGDDANCVTTNAADFGNVGFSFEMSDIKVTWKTQTTGLHK